MADSSERANAIWLAERQHYAELGWEDMFFGECTVNYPVEEKIRKPFANSHEVLFLR